MLHIMNAGLGLLGWEKLKKYFKSKGQEEITEKVRQIVNETFNELNKTIEHRTYLYSFASILILVSISISDMGGAYSEISFWSAIISLMIVGFMCYQTIKSIKFSIYFIENIEECIKELIQKKIEEENVVIRALDTFMEYSGEEYRTYVLADIVRTISSWVKNNKWQIGIRLLLCVLSILVTKDLISEKFML